MGVVYFDVSRLLLRGSLASATGIDRVALAYGRWLAADSGLDAVPVVSIAGRIVRAPRGVLGGILRRAMPQSMRGDSGTPPSAATALLAAEGGARPRLRLSPWVNGLAWHAKVSGAALLRATPVMGRPGDVYLNVTHFGLERPRLLRSLAERGVRSAVLVHDLIPITHPEYVRPGASERHQRRLEGVLRHAHLIIANSQTTAQVVTDYAAAEGEPLPRMRVARLGLEPAFLDREASRASDTPYFVCVGTIEPRKNLGFLLSLWRELAARRGKGTPHLVLVGRRGWENEAVVDLLERAPAVRRWVHEITDLSDDELADLISGARALVSPSFTEGFNLPVAEALALGVPVIASDIPAHRELGGAAALLDPLDGPGWLGAVEAAAGVKRRRTRVRSLRWSDHFEVVGPEIRALAARSGRQ